MLKSNVAYAIHGCEIIISWSYPKLRNEKLFFWQKESIWYWKNYTPIPFEGHLKIVAKTPNVEIKVAKKNSKGLHFIDNLKIKVHELKVLNVDNKDRIDEMVKVNLCGIKSEFQLKFAPKLKHINNLSHIKIDVPDLKNLDYK